MVCPRCRGTVPDSARFCPSCGTPVGSDAPTVGASEQATELAPPGARPEADAATRRHAADSGWLSTSDAISHGRFAPGEILDGRYRIIGLLGRGGMGEVYRADDLRLGQQVALKLLPESLRHDAARLAQFHNEVRTARQVSHPNVCRVYDIGEADGTPYLSMEYVDGEDLATSLRRIGRFPEDRAIDLARQLCAGLAAAHQRGVIHRDLKPANVMLDGAGRVRVMDFGLAAVEQVQSVRAGTPAYMAPEQLRGREVTIRSDIFALGLVLYELVTGRRAFTATSVDELLAQHDAHTVPPPSRFVSALDPAIERAILRCLEPDPQRRPSSALAVAASLPGGDPLAAALAAGETPSPEMVAAAGEGVGLGHRTAWIVFIAVIVGVAASFAIALKTSPLDRMRPQLTSDVLAQKARDVIRQIGYPDRPRDEAYGFLWSEQLIEHVRENDKPAPQWDQVLSRRPSPLLFWYRQNQEPLIGLVFHSDLLTPGIVTPDDPPPTTSGMIQTELDHRGHLVYFEAIPPQRQDAPAVPAAVDWSPLFGLAGLDPSQLQPALPVWNSLATSDTRVAWVGKWPESGRELRVEGAALGGRPVAFMVVGPWTTPWRVPDQEEGALTIYVLILVLLAVAVPVGAAILARKNLREGRGDRQGAVRLATGMSAVLLALWFTQVHFVATPVLFAIFLLAVCTSVFYGVLLWTVYLAFEPIVRRNWPQVLVSWTNVLRGRVRDPVVGRDVLIGAALGTALALVIRVMDFAASRETIATFPGAMELLTGVRSATGVILTDAPYALRNALLYFFLLFVLRMVLRRGWLAALAFATLFALLNALNNDPAWLGAVLGFVYFGSGAFVVLRWGLVALVVSGLVSSLLIDIPATSDGSAWYFGNMLLPIVVVVGLALWAFVTSMRRVRFVAS